MKFLIENIYHNRIYGYLLIIRSTRNVKITCLAYWANHVIKQQIDYSYTMLQSYLKVIIKKKINIRLYSCQGTHTSFQRIKPVKSIKNIYPLQNIDTHIDVLIISIQGTHISITPLFSISTQTLWEEWKKDLTCLKESLRIQTNALPFRRAFKQDQSNTYSI